jgi:uncharacterized membrane protein
MVRVEQSVVIDRPIEAVFAFLAPFANIPRWEAGILEAGQVSPGPLGVGARGRDVRRFMGRRVETTYEVTEYAPPARFAVRSLAGPTPVAARYTLERLAGGTRVRSEADLAIGGPMRLVAPLLSRLLGRQHARDLQRLKGLLEAPPA